MTRPGRWQLVLLDAVQRTPVVSVALVVEAHVDRPPTRAEITAARRAAASLEDAGELRRYTVPVAGRPPALVVSRRDVRPDAAVLARAARTLEFEAPAMKPVRPDALLTRLVASATGAAVRARRADPYAVTPERAQHLADDLGEALVELARLGRQLEQRGGHGRNDRGHSDRGHSDRGHSDRGSNDTD